MENCIPKIKVPSSEEVLNITECFFKKFNNLPQYYVKVPGRVNLIGEHIDYCGYPVFPMALEQGVLIAIKPIDIPQLWITNMDPRYDDWQGDISTSINVRSNDTGPLWYEYVLCGVKGLAATSDSKGINGDKQTNGDCKESQVCGFMAAITGNVPPAAGLSSSSALVCAGALAYAVSNKMNYGKLEMAKLCATSERLIGTEGGGMDQAIAFLAESGSAQFISWNPLRAEAVQLPNEAVFVVAHSLVEANKAATIHFNERVSECRLAAKMLLEESGFDTSKILTLSEVQKLLEDDLEGMIERAKRLPKTVNGLKPRDRAVHVFEEALRVKEFREICDDWIHGKEDESSLSKLGVLMRESHESLRKQYECSHQSLDRLVNLSDEFGVYARLTGAGWGGCIVALCPQQKASAYVNMLKEKFYSVHPSAKDCDIDKFVFITKPHQGATIMLT